MGEKWKNPPVFYTVAQLKFNPVLNMEKYLPEIQDLLRLRGLPEIRQANEAHLKLDMNSRKVQESETTRWCFSDKRRTQAYVLTTESLSYHTTSYVDFQHFSQQVLDGLEDVHNVVTLDHLTRIGLRLLDAVVATPSLSVEDALDPKLFGAFSALGGKLAHSYLETVQNIEERQLISKVFVVANGLPIPPDLHPLPLSLPERLHGLRGNIATLDNDCSSNEMIEFPDGIDRSRLEEQLRSLKNSLNDAFRCATTDLARQEWK